MPYAEGLDGSILNTLCEEPGPWKLAELAREHGEEVEVKDAVARLIARGLAIKMKGGFVVASAAGRYAAAVVRERG
jgi:hypothetical protein